MEIEIKVGGKCGESHDDREHEIDPLRGDEEVQHHIEHSGEQPADGAHRHIEGEKPCSLVLVGGGDAHHAHRGDVHQRIREPEAHIHDHRPHHLAGLRAREREEHQDGDYADEEGPNLDIGAHLARLGVRLVHDDAHQRVGDHVADPPHEQEHDDEPPLFQDEDVRDVVKKIGRHDAGHHIAADGNETVGKFLFAFDDVIGIVH